MLPDSNTFTLTPEQVTALYERGYYANFHTNDNQSGEVRGQVMNWAMEYFGSNLAGSNENPDAVKTTGGGFLMYERCNDQLVATGSFADLSSDFDANVAGGSHLHLGDAAENGGIFKLLTAEVADNLRSGVYKRRRQRVHPYRGRARGRAYRRCLLQPAHRGLQWWRNSRSGPERRQRLPDRADHHHSGRRHYRYGYARDSELDDGTFNAASDPDGDIVVYTVEVTAPDDTEFANVIACQKVGTDTMSNATLDAVYDTLVANGAIPGLSIPLRYRVVASDGSVATPGPSRTITLVVGDDSMNGDTTGVNEFTAYLNGSQELPCPVTTTGSGLVTASLDGNTLTVSGSFTGLESDFDPSVAGGGAHLHAGWPEKVAPSFSP